MAHSHYRGITCTGPLTKAQCDTLWRQYQHGHEGVPCRMDVTPGNVQETCQIRVNFDAKARARAERDDDGAYVDFTAGEQERIRALLG